MLSSHASGGRWSFESCQQRSAPAWRAPGPARSTVLWCWGRIRPAQSPGRGPMPCSAWGGGETLCGFVARDCTPVLDGPIPVSATGGRPATQAGEGVSAGGILSRARFVKPGELRQSSFRIFWLASAGDQWLRLSGAVPSALARALQWQEAWSARRALSARSGQMCRLRGPAGGFQEPGRYRLDIRAADPWPTAVRRSAGVPDHGRPLCTVAESTLFLPRPAVQVNVAMVVALSSQADHPKA